jgi:hypothetical protein
MAASILCAVVRNNKAEVVKSSEARLMGMKGGFSAENEKDFFIGFHTLAGEGGSQHRIAETDGTFMIKEVPDRGEKERAVPVPDLATVPAPPVEGRDVSNARVDSGRSGADLKIVNGEFDAETWRDENGVFGEAMFSPGSERMPGWAVTGGPVCLRKNPPSPAGGFVLELGPRDEPGTVSQTIRTEPGKAFELTFLACAGRNDAIEVRVADVDRTIHCERRFERVSIPFKAAGSETTIRISGAGNEGFGPMIDDVQVNER